MGTGRYSNEAYQTSVNNFTQDGKSKTYRGEETVKETWKLHQLIDPAGYGVIRQSNLRLNPLEEGGYIVPVGAPSTMEYRLDTTGSMGSNVARAIAKLPLICGLTEMVMPEGRDLWYCASIFADAEDKFVLCRGHFEVLAERMIEQLTLMYPERGGKGNGGEDPQYGLFGAAYLTDTYLYNIGLKSMDFTITDEPMHPWITKENLIRVFGQSVFEKCQENGYDITPKNIPNNQEVVHELLKRTHGFVLLVDSAQDTRLSQHWESYYGKERVIQLYDIDHLPHIMAATTGLTEGTLDLVSCSEFLRSSGDLSKDDARRLTGTISHIPLNAQCNLPNYHKLPKAGDFFLNKTDLQPSEKPAGLILPEEKVSTASEDGGWL